MTHHEAFLYEIILMLASIFLMCVVENKIHETIWEYMFGFSIVLMFIY